LLALPSSSFEDGAPGVDESLGALGALSPVSLDFEPSDLEPLDLELSVLSVAESLSSRGVAEGGVGASAAG
jgi:hypothetical protein